MNKVLKFLDSTFLDLGREFKWTYLPPLMVYMAAGISGLTGIVGTFFVKDYLNLSAAFLAGLGFWAGIPWALKMPLGHLVDLIWERKNYMVYLGASLIALSLMIMYGLIIHTENMSETFSVETWFVISVILAPVGYVVQDVVADAMTVEAVPLSDEQGTDYSKDQVKIMHTTMQTLGRFAIIGGTVLVALVNVILFRDVESLEQSEKINLYGTIYLYALVIPLVSIFGVILANYLRQKKIKILKSQGLELKEEIGNEKTEINWWILGGSLVFVIFTLSVGSFNVPFAQEIVFIGSVIIILFLPSVGMYYGFHNWTSSLTGGVVDAKFIALINTALESPLGQVSMIPLLAWIAKNAPSHLKATFFAVFASFTNLALSASALGTKYLNEIFTVTREVKDKVSGEIQTTADYSELGILLIVVTLLTLILPIFFVFIVNNSKYKTSE